MSEEQNLTDNSTSIFIKECDTEKPYIFVSYSSKDRDVVWRDVQYLQQMGFNVWLDRENLQVGKTWNDKAVEAIQSMCCKILIYYVSKDSLCSEPCLKELRTTRDEKTVRLHRDKPLDIIPIDVETIPNIIDYKEKVYDLIEASDRKIDEKQNAIETVSIIIEEFFNNNNAVARIQSKDHPRRKKGYYDEIVQSLPEEACAEDKRQELREQTKRAREEQALAAQEEVARANREEAERRRREEEERLARIAEENRLREENERKARELAAAGITGTSNGTAYPQQGQAGYPQTMQTVNPPYVSGQEQAPQRKKSILPAIFVIAGVIIVFLFISSIKKFVSRTNENEQTAAVPDITASEEIDEPEPVSDKININNIKADETQCFDQDYPPSVNYNVFGGTWENSMLFRAGNGQDVAFGEWNIEGKYKSLALKAFPYIYDGNFFNSSVAMVQVVNAETNDVLFSENLEFDSAMIDTIVDVTGVNVLKIVVVKKQDMLAYCVVDGLLSESELTEEDILQMNGDKEYPDTMNLCDEAPWKSDLVDVSSRPSPSFYLYDRDWTDGLLFRAGNGKDTAYCEWNIGGRYSTLTLEAVPYTYDGFGESSAAEITISDSETGNVIYTGTINFDSDLKIEADVTDVKILKISVKLKSAMRAYSVLDDITVSK